MCHLILMMPLLGIGLFYVLPLAWALPLYGFVLVVSAILYGLIYRTHRQPVASGKESMLGREVLAAESFEVQGQVRYQSVLWKARSTEPLAAGDRATIMGMHGMTLLVQRARSGESGAKSCGCQTTCSCEAKRTAHLVPVGPGHKEELLMKRWFMVPIVAASMVLIAGSVAFAGAPGPSKKLTRTNSAGAVAIDVSWLKPADVSTAKTLTFEVRMNTHSVDLDQYDMARLSRLETNREPSVEPIGWSNPGGGGHHRYGLLKFSSTLPDGSPLIQPGTRHIEVVIKGVGGVAERRFRWDLNLTKTENMGAKPHGTYKLAAFGGN